ncbi:MAG: GNAT family N-acetyltransferase [Bdellovibrionales bacterium]
MELRRIQNTDIKHVMRLYFSCFEGERPQERGDANDVRHYLLKMIEGNIGLGAFDEEKLVGMAFLDQNYKASDFTIESLCVDRAYRGKGYASWIIETACVIADDNDCSVEMLIDKNAVAALAHYKQMGFEISDVDSGEYTALFRPSKEQRAFKVKPPENGPLPAVA